MIAPITLLASSHNASTYGVTTGGGDTMGTAGGDRWRVLQWQRPMVCVCTLLKLMHYIRPWR